MKTKFCAAAIIALIFLFEKSNAQNIFPATGAAGIGTTTPDASSLLDISSTSKGILIPRMIEAERDAIPVSASTKGLLIYQTDNAEGFYYYTGSAWKALSFKGANKSLSNLTAPTAVNVDLLPNASNALNLGSSTVSWKDIYIDGGIYVDGEQFISKVGGSTFLGTRAGNSNAASSNTGIGYKALYSNTTGNNNTANGYSALVNNLTGKFNTANGDRALYSNIDGLNNTATGYNALYSNTSGNSNTATGLQSLYKNADGFSNTANGVYSLYNNTSGDKNTSGGVWSMYNNATGNNNSAFGYNALYSNITGYSNVAIGTGALYKNTAGSNLVAVGDSALYNQNRGHGNTALGSKALYSNTANYGASYNTASGSQSLYSNTHGDYNTASGSQSLYSNTDGYDNTASGSQSLYSNTDGYDNTASGFYSLVQNTTGNGNTALGSVSLLNNTIGFNNTALGANADVTIGKLSNATALGAHAMVNDYNKVRIGNENVTIVESQAGSWTVSDARFKINIREEVKGLEFIKLLRPVVYNFDTKKYEEFLMQNYPDSIKKKRMEAMRNTSSKASEIRQSGFIAQEVKEAIEKSGYNFNGVHAPENPTDNWSLSYEKLVVPLIKAVQELSKMDNAKDSMIQRLNIKIDNMQSQINELKAMIVSNRSTVNGNQSSILSSSLLEQNIPNPFNRTTTINYNLPQPFSSAKIIVTDKAGKILKALNIKGAGKGSLTVDAAMLSSGAYQYSLYVNGRLIDTKQMLLAK